MTLKNIVALALFLSCIARHHVLVAAASPGQFTSNTEHVSSIPNPVRIDSELARRATTAQSDGNSGASDQTGRSLTKRADPNQWSNWLGEQTCTPISKTAPTSLDQLVAVINDAGGKKQRVRAVGSGHSTSDITRTDGGVLIDPHQMAALMDIDTTTLSQGASGTSLIRAQGGILIKDLN